MLAVVTVKTNENLRRCMKEEIKYKGKLRIYYVFVGSVAKSRSGSEINNIISDG
jgi:hypothetical protein